MLEPMGYTLRFPNSIMAVFITYLANYGIPRSGEVLRAAVLTNYEGVPFEKGFGTIVSERVADFVVLLGIIVITLFLQFDFIYNIIEQSFQPTKLIIGGFAALALFVIVFVYIKKSKSKLALKIKQFLKGLIEGVLSIFKMKNKWAFIFHTIFIWLMYVLMFYVVTFALPETTNLPFEAIIVGFVVGGLSMALTNGGLGTYPVFVASALILYNVEDNPARAFGWIMWSAQTLMVIVFGGLSFILLPIYNRNKS